MWERNSFVETYVICCFSTLYNSTKLHLIEFASVLCSEVRNQNLIYWATVYHLCWVLTVRWISIRHISLHLLSRTQNSCPRETWKFFKESGNFEPSENNPATTSPRRRLLWFPFGLANLIEDAFSFTFHTGHLSGVVSFRGKRVFYVQLVMTLKLMSCRT